MWFAVSSTDLPLAEVEMDDDVFESGYVVIRLPERRDGTRGKDEQSDPAVDTGTFGGGRLPKSRGSGPPRAGRHPFALQGDPRPPRSSGWSVKSPGSRAQRSGRRGLGQRTGTGGGVPDDQFGGHVRPTEPG